ncbi:MAG: phosphate transport system regulatory protein PhoU, partial [Parvibaculum sp.]|nr:phosphate transport system regulatory protein PhoU [Parvibaculum sp.]
MTEHTLKAFEEELHALSVSIAQMGGLTEAQLGTALDAIVRRDTQLAERAIASDAAIDDLEHKIEAATVRLIALHQPMAVD